MGILQIVTVEPEQGSLEQLVDLNLPRWLEVHERLRQISGIFGVSEVIDRLPIEEAVCESPPPPSRELEGAPRSEAAAAWPVQGPAALLLGGGTIQSSQNEALGPSTKVAAEPSIKDTGKGTTETFVPPSGNDPIDLASKP